MSDVPIALLGALVAGLGATLFSNSAPPERYTRDASLVLSISDQAGIEQTCQPLFGVPPPGRKTLGCTVGDTVTLPNPCTFPETETYARMLCHELGHVNGWPATHGD